MPSTKPKAPKVNPKKGKSTEKYEPPTSASRKKPRRKAISDDEEDNYDSPPESEEDVEREESIDVDTSEHQSQSRTSRRLKHSMSPASAPDPDRLFEDDKNVDVVNRSPRNDMMDIDIPDRAPTPVPGPSSRRRGGKKKATAVYSDEEDDYIDAGRKQDNKDDEDFIINDSPPVKKAAGRKSGAGGARARGKNAKEKSSGLGEIMIKDERKLPAAPGPGPPGNSKAGAKRRRETVSETSAPPDAQPAATSSTAPPAQASQSKEGAPTAPPPSKIRKLPPIKKIKNLAAAASTAPSSGVSTPSGSAPGAAGTSKPGPPASSNVNLTGLPLPPSLPRKPTQKKTSEVDLTSPDIYNSLFKTGASTQKDGWNSRLKDLQRRKELMKMRDDARAARMANLQKNTFSLLGPQDKVARFETKLRARNSPAVYPNHLGSSLKLIWQSRRAGRTVRPFKKDPAIVAPTTPASASSATGRGPNFGDWNIQLPPGMIPGMGPPGRSGNWNRNGMGR